MSIFKRLTLIGIFMSVFTLLGCQSNSKKVNSNSITTMQKKVITVSSTSYSNRSSQITPFNDEIREASERFGIDERLIKAVIKVESNFQPNVVSRSNTIGLMQVKAATAGHDAYQYLGRKGVPTKNELLDPKTNIEVGTIYLKLLSNQLNGIYDPETKQYAMVVSYATGLGGMLSVFSKERAAAIEAIDRLTPTQYRQAIEKTRPQAAKHLQKVLLAYELM